MAIGTEIRLPNGNGGRNTFYPKTDYENIVDAQEDVVAAHNSLIRGKEISLTWAELKAKTQGGDYSDLYIGDYKEITLTTGEKVVMELAGISTYYNTADTPIGHHLDFISRDCLAGYKKMNNTDTNNGNATNKNPWMASALCAAMNNESNGVFATLPADLKPHIITKRTLVEERYSAGGAVASNTSWSWQNIGKLWLPNEIEVFGCNIWSEQGWGSGQSIQYPIFKLGGYKHIMKGNGKGGTRCNWWEASAHRANATYFCVVSLNGNADRDVASYASVCAPLCFRIG